MKTVLKSVLAIILVAIIAFAGWFFLVFSKTPLYSLGMVGYAYYTKDFPRFERHVDLGAIVNNGYSTLEQAYFKNVSQAAKTTVAKAVAKVASKNALLGALVGKQVNKVVEKAEGTTKDKITAEVRKYAKAYFAKPEEAAAEGTESQSNLKLKDLKQVSKTDTSALMSIFLENGKKEVLPINLSMSKIDKDEWKVVAIQNLDFIVANAKKFKE